MDISLPGFMILGLPLCDLILFESISRGEGGCKMRDNDVRIGLIMPCNNPNFCDLIKVYFSKLCI